MEMSVETIVEMIMEMLEEIFVEMDVEMIVEVFGENSPYWHCVPLKPAGQRHSRSPVSSHWPPLKHVEASHRPADTHSSTSYQLIDIDNYITPLFFSCIIAHLVLEQAWAN